MAVKIQYPAIRSAIENDFKLLRSATFPTQLTGHVPPALLDEVQRGILEETNYLREADNLEYFRQGLSGLPYLTIPGRIPPVDHRARPDDVLPRRGKA